MRIAITNSWPNLPESAEKEFLRRAAIAAKRISFEFCEVVTSDDIESFKPDVVIASHEFTPKLTKYPTLGAMWSPSSLYFNDKNRLKSILSYDGYLIGSELVAQFVEDLTFSTTKNPVLSDFLFLPSTYKIPQKKQKLEKFSIFYAGVHWDGARHGDVFEELDERKILNAYGPESSWSLFKNSYRGRVPFDGNSLFGLLSSHGVALCLHKDAHRQFNTPSMRLFEAAASGAVIISDDFPFVREHFGDSVLYLPKFESGSTIIADHIESHLDWINTNPKLAAEMANVSNRIFEEKLCLEKMLSRLPEFVDRVRVDMGLTVSKNQKIEKSVQYIVRIGSRPKDMIRRCLDSLARQTYANVHLIIVAYRKVHEIDSLIAEFDSRFQSLKYIEVQDSGFRSSALWAGLNEISCDYFAVQDDDDELHPNHVQKCINTLAETESKFVYTGVVKHEESPNVYFSEQNFAGSEGVVIKETRRLQFLDGFSQEKMIKFENYIQSNTWLASRELLDAKILCDPKLVVAEDVYLYNLLMAKGPFATVYSPTAEWNWRSSSEDNSMLGVAQDIWVNNVDRIRRRLSHLSFDKKILFADMNPVSGDPSATEVVKRDLGTMKRFMTLNQSMPFNSVVPDIVKCKGISYPEELGTWSNAKTLYFTIPIKKQIFSQPIFLVFSGHAAIYPTGLELKLTVSTKDMQTLGTCQFKNVNVITKGIVIPAAMHESGQIELRFDFDSTFNPSRAGAGNDDRELAFFFQSIGLFESSTGIDLLSETGEHIAPLTNAIEEGQFFVEKYSPYNSTIHSKDSIDVDSSQLIIGTDNEGKCINSKLTLRNVVFNGVVIGTMVYELLKHEKSLMMEFREKNNKSVNLIRWDKISFRRDDDRCIAYLFDMSEGGIEVFVSEYNFLDVLWQKIQNLIFLNLSELITHAMSNDSYIDCQEGKELGVVVGMVTKWTYESIKCIKND